MPDLQNSLTARRSNSAAILIAAVAMVTAISSFDPVPAGEEPKQAAATSSEESNAAETNGGGVPVPPEASSVEKRAEPESEILAADASTAAPEALDESDDLQQSLEILRQGQKFLQSVNSYTAVFHKTERLGGDLQARQNIDIKVSHNPGFSIYMKWQNFEKGRQLLFNSSKNDGKALVKKGGSRLMAMLPTLKIDPDGSLAMAESRYPVTEAGLLAMTNRIIAIREQEMKDNCPLTCTQLENTIVDGRECLVYLYEFKSNQTSPIYRTSRITIDVEYRVPVHVVNHTWATAGNELSDTELNERTLLEDYAFSRIDFGVTLVGEDFERNNPRYRM